MTQHHFEHELLALDERIRRLALSCGVDLSAPDRIAALIKGDYSVCARARTPKHEELRGLLMLKYHIEESCIAQLGIGDCKRIVEAEEAELKRRGFRS
jgi:hypothetical protein